MKNYAAELICNMKVEEGKEYMYKLITYSLAPVLLGEKCASLICLSDKNKNMFEMWKEHKKEYLSMLPINCYEVGNLSNTFTLVFYNEMLLSAVTRRNDSRDFLKKYGYNEPDDPVACLEVLKTRLLHECPHEMGLLLGIPLEDVKAFIRNAGKNYIYCGYWKVYYNLQSALNTFYLYEKAREELAKIMVTEKTIYKTFETLKKSMFN